MAWLTVIAFSVAILTVLGQEKIPKIITDAEDYHGFVDKFTRLKVTTNEVPGAKYHWKRDGVLIDGNSKPAFEDTTSTILKVSGKSDKGYEGIYQFFMETAAGTIAGRNVSVSFTCLGQFSSPKPGRIDVVVGQATYINCPEHTGGKNLIYKWGRIRKGSGLGTRFVAASEHYIVLNDGTLFFSHLTRERLKYINSFKAMCVVEASAGTDNRFQWSDVFVEMKETGENFTKFGPKIVTKLPEKQFQKGETIFMKCASTGNPLPNYSWRMVDDEGNEKTIENGKDGFKFEDGDPRILLIKEATRQHSGRYWCTATIGKKNDSVEGRLIFQEKPTLLPPKIQSAKPSIYSHHSWQCNATGHPMPTYWWYANGTLLVNSTKHEIDGGKITIRELEKEDSGMYQCVAQNSVDSIIGTAYLDVQAEKPVFETNTGKTTLYLQNEGKIECYAYAAPKAKNTWKKDGVVIDTSLPKYELRDNQDLVIKNVSKADMGNYTCAAQNLYGNDTKEIEVCVLGEITFVQEPKPINVTVGKQVNLYCEAKGEKSLPTPIKYKWNFDGKELQLKSDGGILWIAHLYKLVVLDAKVRHTGLYECIAYIDKPFYIEERRSARVIVRGPPEAPYAVEVKEGCGNLTAKVEWKTLRKSFVPITHFIIKSITSYDPRGIWKTVAEKASPNINQFEVKDLSPHTKYSFHVIAVNGFGRSEPSKATDFKDCQTPERPPTVCPAVSAEAGKANQLTIKWKAMPLIDHNGEDFEYNLQYRKDKKVWKSRNLTANTTSFSVPEAGYYQQWEFHIRGINNAGFGPNCSGEARSGQNAPKVAPENFKVNNTGLNFVVVEWKPIILKLGSIDGYKLRYWQNSATRRRRAVGRCESKEKACEEDIIGGTRSSFRVDGLHPDKLYNMELSGYNSGGRGPSSKLDVVTAKEKPTNVHATAYAKYIKLEWGEPERPNGVITGYTVSISGTRNDEKSLGPEARTFVFCRLQPENTYLVTIRAHTKRSGLEKCEVRVTTKKEAVPVKPKAPLVKGTGEYSVRVTFQEGIPVQGFPEKFYTVYREKGVGKEMRSGQQPLIGYGGLSFIVVPGLNRTKEYEFATIAVNYHGESERSHFSSSFPGDGGPTAPKMAPEHFKVKVITFDSVEVEWKPIPGNIDGYKLQYWQNNSCTRHTQEVGSCESEATACKENITGGNTSSYKVHHLLPAQRYTVELSGYNTRGRGPSSKLTVVTADEMANVDARTRTPFHQRDWFLPVVAAVCLLVLLIVITVLLTRKGGERYPVAERERKKAAFLDDWEDDESVDSYPMKPLRNHRNGINRNSSARSSSNEDPDHDNPDDCGEDRNPCNGVNRNNSIGAFVNKDPDCDSLGDYGEDRFGEDADSFIGEYSDERTSISIEAPQFV